MAKSAFELLFSKRCLISRSVFEYSFDFHFLYHHWIDLHKIREIRIRYYPFISKLDICIIIINHRWRHHIYLFSLINSLLVIDETNHSTNPINIALYHYIYKYFWYSVIQLFLVLFLLLLRLSLSLLFTLSNLTPPIHHIKQNRKKGDIFYQIQSFYYFLFLFLLHIVRCIFINI